VSRGGPDRPGFVGDDLTLLETFGVQASFALEFGRARDDLRRLAVLSLSASALPAISMKSSFRGSLPSASSCKCWRRAAWRLAPPGKLGPSSTVSTG
jgi:hypothetical protein